MSKALVLYHASCADGFTAAWAAWRKLGDDADYQPIQHDDPMPDCVGYNTVYFLDFAPKDARTLVELADRTEGDVEKFIILDHHKTAQAALESLGGEPVFQIEFDMDRSGAMMAWEYFFPGTSVPPLVQYVQDRDLWRWKLPFSEEISTVIQTTKFEFELWDKLNDKLSNANDFKLSKMAGAAMLQYAEAKQDTIVGNHGWTRLEGHLVPCVNDGNWQSELGNKLSKEHYFAVIWFMKDDGGFVYSLRSDKDRPDEVADVSEIARRFSGGGHRHAAGFRASAPPVMVPGPEDEDG